MTSEIHPGQRSPHNDCLKLSFKGPINFVVLFTIYFTIVKVTTTFPLLGTDSEFATNASGWRQS